jgi:hypothetical protein
MRKLIAAALLAGAALAAPANAATVLNGSFEAGLGINPFGWTVTSIGGRTGSMAVFPEGYIATFPAADTGVNALRIRSSADNTWVLTQTVATNVGQSYVLRYSMLNQNANAFDSVTVTTGNVTTVFGDRAPFEWTAFTQAFTAVSTSTVIQFAIRHTGGNSQNFMYLDSVALSVPEPGTWGMMMAGFGLVGFAARRRKAIAA